MFSRCGSVLEDLPGQFSTPAIVREEMRSVYSYNYAIYASAYNFMCMPFLIHIITARSYIVVYVYIQVHVYTAVQKGRCDRGECCSVRE